MRKLKKMAAAMIASAMIIGMSFSVLAAEYSFGVTASAIKDSGKASIIVTADQVDLNATVLKFEYDTAIFSNPVVDTSKIPSLNSTIINTEIPGEVWVTMAGLESLVQKDVISISFDVNAGIGEEELKSALAGVKLLPQDVYDASGNQVVAEGSILDENGSITEEKVPDVTVPADQVEITDPVEQPTETPGGATEDPGDASPESPAPENPGTEAPAGPTEEAPEQVPTKAPENNNTTAPITKEEAKKEADTAIEQAQKKVEEAEKNAAAAGFTEGGLQKYKSAMARLQAILADPNATAEAIQAATNELQMIEQANAAVVAGTKKNLSGYASAKVQKYKEALANLEKVLADPNASMEDVQKALAAVQEAEKALTADTVSGNKNVSPRTADTASVVIPVVGLCSAAAAVVVSSRKRIKE